MIAQLIAEHFARFGYTWTRNGQRFSPTESDVQRVLDAAARILYSVDSTDTTPQYERGGIIVQKTNDTMDVFVKIGETQ